MSNYPVNMNVEPEVEPFFDPATNTISYVVKDPNSDSCAIVDSVMDIDYAAGRITYDSADKLIEYIKANKLKLEWLIETHVHADHLSGAPYIQEQLGGKIGIGRNITTVQDTFGKVFNEGTEFQRDGSQFDAVRRWRHLHDRRHARLRDLHARPHARLHDPCDGQRGLRRRHALHARWRLRALRLPGRLGRNTLRVDPEGPQPAR
jgi:glyoxylase-like metal-dependent hydrolase (beta-lactamase superfamily II)